MAGTLTVGGLAAGLLTGVKQIGPLTDIGTAVIGTVTDLTLAAGDNAIAVPSGATHVLIELPASSTVPLNLRTNLNPGDGGLPFGPSGWLKVPLVSGTTSLIINAASSGGVIEATFI